MEYSYINFLQLNQNHKPIYTIFDCNGTKDQDKFYSKIYCK